MTRTVWGALTIREHLWQRRDFSKRLGVIRAVARERQVPGGKDAPNWGPPVAGLHSSGPASVIHASYPLGDLVAWLKRFDPHYALTYPTVAAALLTNSGGGRIAGEKMGPIQSLTVAKDGSIKLGAKLHVGRSAETAQVRTVAASLTGGSV